MHIFACPAYTFYIYIFCFVCNILLSFAYFWICLHFLKTFFAYFAYFSLHLPIFLTTLIYYVAYCSTCLAKFENFYIFCMECLHFHTFKNFVCFFVLLYTYAYFCICLLTFVYFCILLHALHTFFNTFFCIFLFTFVYFWICSYNFILLSFHLIHFPTFAIFFKNLAYFFIFKESAFRPILSSSRNVRISHLLSCMFYPSHAIFFKASHWPLDHMISSRGDEQVHILQTWWSRKDL